MTFALTGSTRRRPRPEILDSCRQETGREKMGARSLTGSTYRIGVLTLHTKTGLSSRAIIENPTTFSRDRRTQAYSTKLAASCSLPYVCIVLIVVERKRRWKSGGRAGLTSYARRPGFARWFLPFPARSPVTTDWGSLPVWVPPKC